MRVLMVSRGVLPVGRRSGGAELAAFELARHLALQAHEVTLIADVEPEMMSYVTPGLSVRHLAKGRLTARLLRLIPLTFARWLCQHLVGNTRAARIATATLLEHEAKFDVVHTHGALASLMISRTLRRLGVTIPLVYTEHDSTPWSCAPRGGIERVIRNLVYRFVNLQACHHVSKVVTSYVELAEELAARTGLGREHFTVVPNGADVERFVPADSINPSASEDEHYFLFVGSLIERKGPDLLLRAFAAAKIDLRLVLIGGGPMAQELKRLANRLRVADRVDFVGAQPQNVVHRYCQGADFLALPSVSETMPLVLLEALSTGTPVIATDLSGIATIVRHGENGLLVPPGDVPALAAAMRLMATDEDLQSRLASNAISSIREDFSWRAVANRICMAYERLEGAHQRGSIIKNTHWGRALLTHKSTEELALESSSRSAHSLSTKIGERETHVR